jgi:hypothetical protein
MIKFLGSLVLVGILSFLAYLYADITPWWAFAVGAFIAGIAIPQKAGVAFFAAFLSVFLLWGFLTWQIDNANNGLLSGKMASILPLGGSSWALMVVSAAIGGITAGLAAATGTLLRKKV